MPFYVPYKATRDYEKEKQYLMNARTGKKRSFYVSYYSHGILQFWIPAQSMGGDERDDADVNFYAVHDCAQEKQRIREICGVEMGIDRRVKDGLRS